MSEHNIVNEHDNDDSDPTLNQMWSVIMKCYPSCNSRFQLPSTVSILCDDGVLILCIHKMGDYIRLKFVLIKQSAFLQALLCRFTYIIVLTCI